MNHRRESEIDEPHGFQSALTLGSSRRYEKKQFLVFQQRNAYDFGKPVLFFAPNINIICHSLITTTRNQGPGNNEQSTPDFASEQSRCSESTPPNETHEGGVEVAASIGGILEEMSRGVSYDDHDTNDPLAELKRPRACDACRQLKVRCVFENDISFRPCKRCAKANRKCTVTPPVRKRQKKTENRVSELEKKIEALTATLQASSRAESMVPPDAASQYQARTTASTRRWMGDGPPPASSISPRIGTKRTSSGDATFSALPGNSFMGPVR